MKKPFADAIIGLLIIEDLAAVMILTFISPLASGQTPGMNTFISELFGILGFLALSIIIGLAVVPKIINWVGKEFNDEVLLLVSLGFCFAASIFAFFIGLSVAIGAFILGVVISESRENERIANKIDSIKIMFMAIFFVSIGLLIDPWLVLQNLPLVLIIAAIFIFGKLIAVTLACFVSNQTMRTSVTAGFAMVAMGEFSFVIAKVGLDTGAVSSTFYSCVIGAALITMVVMPSAFGRSTKSLDWAVKNIPRALYVPIRRMESMRAEMNRSFAKHNENRGKITRQAFWILIDFTILFLIQVFIGAIYDISRDLKPIAEWLGLIPSTLAAIISVALLIPPMVDVMVRIRRIGYIIVQSVLEGGNYHWDSGRMILKQFVNFFFIIVGVIFFLAILPFNGYYKDFPMAALAGLLIGTLIAYLIWDINKATYEKMCTVLTTGLIDPKDEQR
jgi:CPA2 family monovalent cation:H+ antiporter-2